MNDQEIIDAIVEEMLDFINNDKMKFRYFAFDEKVIVESKNACFIFDNGIEVYCEGGIDWDFTDVKNSCYSSFSEKTAPFTWKDYWAFRKIEFLKEHKILTEDYFINEDAFEKYGVFEWKYVSMKLINGAWLVSKIIPKQLIHIVS